jgi:ADP-heptose:LPS heptosyltransferase
VLEQRGVEFVSLQYGTSVDEIAQAGVQQVIHQVNGIDDLDELAALMSALDLVITIDNTVGHLAGALGRPVWILLPFSPEWRYLRSGTSMPWYPSARLFRQPEPRAWAGVMDEVAAALAALRGDVDA